MNKASSLVVSRTKKNKYIANYKERVDSLLSYQKKLHEIIAPTKKDEVKIRAISELHSLEKTIFDMWKQLPTLDISDQVKQQEQDQEREEGPPIFDVEDINGVEDLPAEVQGLWHNWEQCDHCKRWWKGRELLDYHRKRSNNACAIPNVVEVTTSTISTCTSEPEHFIGNPPKSCASDDGQEWKHYNVRYANNGL